MAAYRPSGRLHNHPRPQPNGYKSPSPIPPEGDGLRILRMRSGGEGVALFANLVGLDGLYNLQYHIVP
jgi:hypothetical protein